MNGPRDYHPKWTKSERETEMPCDITYTWNLKYNTNEFVMKQKQTHRHREQTYGHQGQRGVEEGCTGSLALADANYHM